MPPSIKKYLPALFIIFGCLAACFDIFLSDWTGDECYQALSVRDFRNCPLAMLTFALGHAATAIFGDQLVVLRALRSLCYIFSIGAACLYLYRRSGGPILCSMLFMMLCGAFPFATLTIFNWDTVPYPFIILSIIALLEYMRHPSAFRIVMAGIFTSCAIMSRIPLACILLIDLTAICLCRKKLHPILTDCTTGLAALFVTAILLSTLMCGSPLAYVESFSPENIITGHADLARLKWRILTYLPLTFYPWPIGITAIVAGFLTRRFPVSSLATLAALAATLVVTAIVGCIITSQFDSFWASGLLLPLFILIAVIAIAKSSGRDRVAACVAVAFAFTTCVGSDTFFQRTATLITIPILLIFIPPTLHPAIKRIISLTTAAVALLLCFQTAYLFKITGHSLDNFPHMRHLRANRLITDRFDALRPVIDSLNTAGARYNFTGPGKYEPTYVFLDDTGIDFQTYHYDNPTTDSIAADHLAQSPEADNIFVVDIMVSRNHHLAIADTLVGRGYTIKAETPFYLLLQR